MKNIFRCCGLHGKGEPGVGPLITFGGSMDLKRKKENDKGYVLLMFF